MQVFKSLLSSWRQYLNVIFIAYIFSGMIRIIQAFYATEALDEISLGLLSDILQINLVLLIFFLPFAVLYSMMGKKVVLPWIIFVLLVYIAGLPFWNYGLLKGELINPFQFGCSLSRSYQEAMGNTTLFSYIITILFAAVTLFVWHVWKNKNIRWPNYVSPLVFLIALISVPVLLEIRINVKQHNKGDSTWVQNPGFYVIEKQVYCIAGWQDSDSESEPHEQYQAMHPDRSFPYPGEYPFLKTQKAKNCLTTFFPEKTKEEAPDIVFLLLEGLGDTFLDTLYDYPFMPFLRSLADSSLYRDRHFAVSEEAQNFLPALLGGLPPSQRGFSEMPVIPYHFSLMNILHHNQYHGSFYTGQWSWDHSTDKFLMQNRISQVYDAGNFPEEEEKIFLGDDQYFWGYNDRQLFDFYFESKKETEPRLDIIYTRGIRSPFAIENREYYRSVMDSVIAKQKSTSEAEYLELFHPYYLSLMFTDNQLESFFNRFKKEPDYENTVFIITGSFPTPELHPEANMDKYHVPMIIYSPMLTKTGKISDVTSHYDFYESITGLLQQNFDIEIPRYNTSWGKTLCVKNPEEQFIPLLDAQNKLSSMIHDNYFLHQDTTLYPLGENNREMTNQDETKHIHTSVLKAFEELNLQPGDALMPDSVFFNFFGHQVVEEMTIGKSFVRTEYKDIVDNMFLEQKTYHMDVVIEKPEVSLEEVFLIFEVKDASDQVVFWENFGIPETKNDFSIKLTIEKDMIPKEGAQLKVYIWNQSPVPYGFDAIPFRIYN